MAAVCGGGSTLPRPFAPLVQQVEWQTETQNVLFLQDQ